MFDIADQLDTLIHADHWKRVVSFVSPRRNRVARFLAKLGMDTCNKLYTFDMTVGSVEELLDWDQGMGLHHPNFMDVFVSHNAPDTVNFNISMSVAEQMEDLSLGQINAP